MYRYFFITCHLLSDFSLTQFPPFASEYESKALIEALAENFLLLDILFPATFHKVLRRDQIGREEICQVRGKRS